MKLSKFRRSPATVIALAALFVALGGVGIAANGQSLILGTRNNAATAQTGLTATSAEAALAVTNNSTGSPLRLTGPTAKPPLLVNSATKVGNLNADLLDGRDESYFLPASGKAANSDNLDGLDSNAFTQGGGHLYHSHAENVPSVAHFPQGTLLDIPGVLTVTYTCFNQKPTFGFEWSKLRGVIEENGALPYYFPPTSTSTLVGPNQGTEWIHVLVSRPTVPLVSTSAVADVDVSGFWDTSASVCNFAGVAQLFG